MAIVNNINNNTANLTVDSETGLDPYVQYSINQVDKFRMGVDDDDADTYKISLNNALGTDDCMRITADGENLLDKQPFVLGYFPSIVSNVTGNGTIYTLAYTEIFDVNNDFSSTTFTAPVSGFYLINANIIIRDLSAGHTSQNFAFTTSNRTYNFANFNPFSVSNAAFTAAALCSCPTAAQVDMDNGDTLTFTATVFNSTQTVGVHAAAFNNFMSISLIQ